MEDINIKAIWHAYDDKLAHALQLNHRLMTEVQTQKARTVLHSLRNFKIGAVLLGVVWIAVLAWLVSHTLHYRTMFFAASAGIVLLFNVLAIGIYLRHIILLQQLNNSNSVIDTQKQLAKLQASTIRYTRMLFLQLPFYTTWWYAPEQFFGGDLLTLLIQLPVTLLFTWLAIWLYHNIDERNKDKRWFRILFSNKEWTDLVKAQHFLKEIDELETGAGKV